MKKSLVVTLLVLMGAAVPWAAAALEVEDCQYHNAKLDVSTGTLNFDPPGDYDFCLEGAKLVGTLNGTYTSCVDFDTFVSSDTIFGDGWTQIETAKYDSWVETKKGTLVMSEWSWWDGDFGVETGFAKVISGSGVFEGKVGSLLWHPIWPGSGKFDLPLEGYICTPVP